MSLPKEINYSKQSSLPRGTTTTSAVIAPANGATFGESQLIQFNLPNRSYLVGSSIYLRFRTTTSGSTALGPTMRGSFPATSFFTRLETVIGSSTVESISNFGIVNNMLLSCKVNYAQKFGMQYNMAIGTNAGLGGDNAAVNFQNLDGHYNSTAVGGESYFASIPLNCLFANADTLIPLKYMPASTIQLTTDTIANCFASGTSRPTSITLDNLELCMDLVDFNEETDRAVESMVDERGNIMIKSQSYLSSGQTANSGLVGSVEYIYSMRLASIKSLYLLPQGVSSFNGSFDCLDITSGNGAYQFFIASNPYPSRPLNTKLNKAGILSELSSAFGPQHDLLSTNFSISYIEFDKTNTGTATTHTEIGKCYIGCNTEKLSTNSVLLSGVSSQNSPISVRIDVNTTTTQAQVLNLVALFDAIIEVNVANRQVNVLQ